MQRKAFASNTISKLTISGLAGLLVLGAAPAFAGTTVLFPQLSATPPEVTSAKELRVVGVPLEAADETSAVADATLSLRPMEVFARDARITIQTPAGEVLAPRPGHAYFGGSIEGRPASRAILAFLDRGGVRGFVQDGASWWRIGEVEDKSLGTRQTVVRRVEPGAGESFQCGNGDLLAAVDSLNASVRQADPATLRPGAQAKGAGASYTARIAFETDEEYLALFGGNTTDATDYVGDLVALGSMIYTDEVATSWIVESVNLWTTTDPWDESPGGCALYEFGKYWNDNNAGIDRTIAHMLSGKSTNSGVAWVGVLCSGAFLVDLTGAGCGFGGIDFYGGDYGFTGGIDGNLDINSPAPLWDSVAVLHEIGHNFNSPHTHCYNGIGGSASPIDMCYSGQDGCYSGPVSLPAGCPGVGSNCGTIMSYCHLNFAGGIGANVDLVLGDSPYGVLPGRVPDRMSDHVVSEDLLNPGCLDFTAADQIFSDGFESGDTSAWSVTVN